VNLGLNIFGASHFAYWTSWFVVSNLYALIVATSTYTAGWVFGFGFFVDTPFYMIIFLLMYPFTLAIQMLAYFISALAPSLKASNTISYGIMLFAIVVESFVSDNFLLTFLFSEDVSPVVAFLKVFLCFYPPFSYTKVLFLPFRSLRISPNIQASTLASLSADGSVLLVHTTWVSIPRIYRLPCPSVEDSSTVTQTCIQH
jgi:hypothetical protein